MNDKVMDAIREKIDALDESERIDLLHRLEAYEDGKRASA